MFTYKDEPIKRIWSYSWRNACRRAGIKDLRFHDLRHTWASWHAQAGTPLSVLQELGGWRTTAMVQRYAHLTVRNLIAYAEKIVPDTNLAQMPIKAVEGTG